MRLLRVNGYVARRKNIPACNRPFWASWGVGRRSDHMISDPQIARFGAASGGHFGEQFSRHIGGYARVIKLSAPLAILTAAERADGQTVRLCIFSTGRECPVLPLCGHPTFIGTARMDAPFSAC
jgi:hypothetical protein